ncbi:hypothetical protein Mal64_33920 [Pseudobythopirellula maris]|uniref:DUF3566 domain-containing protein n=1 Tax=Pseudobythopirellula maris TaxID=2527991 RepID=A0A5C5ZH77_9BACT|nr:hypothetical protein [Pseudobythopirellula maris]TWT86566.1 hypothetical protein Mal64_33920 [Pseudobythopirellula maris]
MSDNPYQAAPAMGSAGIGAVTATKELKHVHPLQAGKVLGVMYALMGLIILPFFLIAAVMNPNQAAPGLVVAVLIPIFYAVGGFVGGIIMAAVYNLVAGMAGGIRMDFE